MTIKFRIKEKLKSGFTTNEAGRLIKELVNEEIQPGSYIARWDGLSSKGTQVPSGSYFAVVKTDGKKTVKLVRMK